MHRLLLGAAMMSLVGFGCSTPATPTPDDQSPVTSVENTIYTSFIINVHDFSQPEQSIATLNRIIDLHEEYNVPVDMYLDDALVQIYETQAQDLLERLKTSPVVAVSYHLRPPTPYYENFHPEQFDGMSDNELYDALLRYETHAVDLTTGEATDEPGGYVHLKGLMGYAPYVVAQASGNTAIAKMLARIYKDAGAMFVLRHGKDSDLGDTSNGLYLRPEHVEVKAYERKNEIPVETLFAEAIERQTDNAPFFVNLKWHENNFYSSGTNWSGMYYAPGKKGEVPLDPPYDLSLWTTTETDKSDEEERIQWERYEAALAYVVAHPETFTAINAKDVLAFLQN